MREVQGEIVGAEMEDGRLRIRFQVGDELLELWGSEADQYILDVGAQWVLNIDASNTIQGGTLWAPARHLGAFGGQEVVWYGESPR